MRIIVNHLTRMAYPYICVAGIDPDTGASVRPVAHGRLPRELLRSHGGPFDIAGLVDLGEVAAAGAPPEVEDYSFTHWRARYLETWSPRLFWGLMELKARATLAAIFGPSLEPTGHTYAVTPGRGIASLGCLIPHSRHYLVVEQSGSLRLRLADSGVMLSLPVTDLRFFADDQQTVRVQVVADVNRRLGAGVRSLLSVGLTRPWTKPGESEPRHWLQVNNIHLEDAPVWQFGAG